MKMKLILSLPLAVAISLIVGCGKTMNSTPVQRGNIKTKAAQVLNSGLIHLADITEPKAKCFSLALLSNKLKQQGSIIANNLALINTEDLELGTGKARTNFSPLSDNPANEAIRANLLLQPTKWNIGPIYQTTIIGDIATSNHPDIQKIAALLTASNQDGCSSVVLGNSPTPARISSSSATTLRVDEAPGGAAREYEIRQGGLLITTYTDFDVLSGQKTPSLCGNTQPLVVKQTFYIHFGRDIKDLTISSPLLRLMKEHLNTPAELIGTKDAKEEKKRTKALTNTVQFAKDNKLKQVPVSPVMFGYIVNAINSPGHVVNLGCPKQ